jgi:hypothetical protein
MQQVEPTTPIGQRSNRIGPVIIDVLSEFSQTKSAIAFDGYVRKRIRHLMAASSVGEPLVIVRLLRTAASATRPHPVRASAGFWLTERSDPTS